jgi:type VI protein secretion system component Hcp
MKQPFLIASLIAVTMSTAQAQPAPGGKYEMQIEGIPGQAKLTLEIESWSWGAVDQEPDDTDPKSQDAAGKKKKSDGIQEVYFVVEQSPTSPMLLQSLLAKKPMTNVVLHSTGTSGKSFELVMKEVRLTSYQTGGSGGFGRAPMDQMSMSFKTAKLTVGDGGTTHSAQITGRK